MSVPLVFSPRALMGKVCAWHCILSSQRKYVLLCAISLGACGNEGAQRRQTFDRQEWYYDILMCSAAGKYSSCLHFLFRGGFDTFWFGTSVFFCFFLNGFHPSLSLPRWRRRGKIGNRSRATLLSLSLSFPALPFLDHPLLSITLSVYLYP